MSPEAEALAALQRLEGAVVDAAATKLAEAILARPMFGDVIVKAIVDEIGRCAREKVEPMIARILVERAGDTFAAVDEAVGLVRAETLRAAQQRVAENLPSRDEVRRESLAIIREAVVRALEPTIFAISGQVERELGVSADAAKAVPPIAFPSDDSRPKKKMGTLPAGPPPASFLPAGAPGGPCSARNDCKCDNCSVPF